MLRTTWLGTLATLLAIVGCKTPPPDVTPAIKPPAHSASLHNVQQVAGGLISGSVPEDEAGFDELEAMGVRTIISVDGATPDVKRAHARGMRYVHIPVGYDGIDAPQAQILAKAAHDLPGPIYVHCHHGKHRGPAACAIIAIQLGSMNPQDADAFLREAGTSPDYPGLFASVAAAAPLNPAQLEAIAPDFPEVAPRPAFVTAMSMAQDALDHLTEIRDASWAPPPHHPDLVPVAEAARLESLLRGLIGDAQTQRRPADFQQMMSASHAAAVSLESALTRGEAQATLTTRLKTLADSCRDCHVQYRNQRP